MSRPPYPLTYLSQPRLRHNPGSRETGGDACAPAAEIADRKYITWRFRGVCQDLQRLAFAAGAISLIGRYPGVPVLLAWCAVLVVTVLLCINAESRDYLLGHYKALSVFSLCLLSLVLTLTLVGWSVTHGFSPRLLAGFNFIPNRPDANSFA